MLAQHGQGADQEAEPGRAGHASAETCEGQTISSERSVPHPRDLDLDLERLLAVGARRLPENAAVLLSRRSQPLGKLPLGLRAVEDRIDLLRPARLCSLRRTT